MGVLCNGLWSAVLAALAVHASISFGGVEHGNGGDVVVCPNATANSRVRLLDYYEAEKRGHTVNMGYGTLEERIEQVLLRLQSLDHGRANYYRTRVNYFLRNADFLRGISLQDIDDSSHIILDAGCHLEQIAVRVPPRFPNQNRKLFIVNQDLWDQLSLDHKAGLVLHEVIFEDVLFSTWDYRTLTEVSLSPLARYFNGVISSGRVSNLYFGTYNQLLRDIRLTPDKIVTSDSRGRVFTNVFFVVNDSCPVPWEDSNGDLVGCLYRPTEVFPQYGDEFTVAAQNTWTRFLVDGNLAKPVAGTLAKAVPGENMNCGERFIYQELYGIRPSTEVVGQDVYRCWYEILLP